MSKSIETLKTSIRPVRERLIGHPVYRRIKDPAALRIFMEHHVYAVWDFMSLLKALQQSLTCVTSPWVPVGSANTRYLINEIVVGEESDVDERGLRTSHFELYLRAMEQAGADTRPVVGMVEVLKAGRGRAMARPMLEAGALWSGRAGMAEMLSAGGLAEAPDGWALRGPVGDFLDFTFGTIARGEVHRIAAVFTFGREDLIPDMFIRIVEDLSGQNSSAGIEGPFGIFTYYLERHIEVDGGHHSHLAMAMLEELCGEDDRKWEEAAQSAGAALEARIRLWDGVVERIDGYNNTYCAGCGRGRGVGGEETGEEGAADRRYRG
jgi:hypothetical protein